MNELVEVRSTKRFNAVGHCIYCGSKEELSDEHVVPFALGGALILPDASCHTCAAITSKFERIILRGFMYRARNVAKFPTRRPKKRPQSMELQIIDEQCGERTVNLPTANFPALLHLPLLLPAAFLNGRIPKVGVELCGIDTLSFGTNPYKALHELKVRTMKDTVNFDATAFVRMLAKIGYSFAVGVLGSFPLNEVPVLPIIMGQADDGSVWVGSAEFET